MNLAQNKNYSDAFGEESRVAVTRYDQVSGFLIAAVGLAGITTGLMALLIFLNMNWDRSFPSPMFVFEEFPGVKKPEGIAEDFREPGVEELAETDEPQLADALEMVTNAVSTRRAAIEKIDGTSDKSGPGDGLGDRRKTGIGDNGPAARNPAQHWVIRYSTSSKESYAAQLDFFKIEIGSVSKNTAAIEYVSKVSAPRPIYKKGVRKEEKRVYFKKPAKHPVLIWDKSFLEAVGATTDDRYILTFYPDGTIEKLAALEKKALERDKKKSVDVKRTVFTVEQTKEGGYEYKLSSIKYQ